MIFFYLFLQWQMLKQSEDSFGKDETLLTTYCCLINCYLFQLLLLVHLIQSRNTKNTNTHTHLNQYYSYYSNYIYSYYTFKSFSISNTTNQHSLVWHSFAIKFKISYVVYSYFELGRSCSSIHININIITLTFMVLLFYHIFYYKI
eukprot:437982_1